MKYLKYFENLTNFDHSREHLTTLEYLNIPKIVYGDFDFSQNNIASLKFGPESVGEDFMFRNNELTSLEFGPISVGSDFNVKYNRLTSLEFSPKNIGWDFDCSHNKITSLEFMPKELNASFYCYHNELTSLEFCPKNINGWFNCSNNKLTSLEFCPEYVKGFFICNDNPWTNPISFELIKKHNIHLDRLYTDEQKEKFGSYEYQKEFLTETPEKYKDLEYIGYNEKIKEEFDWLFNAADMGLM